VKIEFDAVMEKLTDIFRGVFDEDSLILTGDMSAKDIEEWDSLAQINLILAIEATFKLKFKPSEIESLGNVGEMAQLIMKKTND